LATLAERAAAEAPDFLIGGPVLLAPDGVQVALERTGRRLALLVPHGAKHCFRVVPADRARVEAARPPQLAVATGNLSRPWVRAPLPQGPEGAAFLQLLGSGVRLSGASPRAVSASNLGSVLPLKSGSE